MRSRYPIEAFLRPPVELVSTVVAGAAAWLAWIAPWAWMTTPAGGTRRGRGSLGPRARAAAAGPPDPALPAQPAPPARLPLEALADPGQRDPALPGKGLPLDPAPHPAPRRHAPSRGPALCRARALVSLGTKDRDGVRAPRAAPAPGSSSRPARLVESARTPAARRRRSGAPRGRAFGRSGHHAALGSRRPYARPRHDARRQDPARRAPHHPGPPAGRDRHRLRSQGRRRAGQADLDRSEARRSRARVLLLPPGLSGAERPLQRRRRLRADHRGRDPDREPAPLGGQQRGLPGVRLALRQHHRPGARGPRAGAPTTTRSGSTSPTSSRSSSSTPAITCDAAARRAGRRRWRRSISTSGRWRRPFAGAVRRRSGSTTMSCRPASTSPCSMGSSRRSSTTAPTSTRSWPRSGRSWRS